MTCPLSPVCELTALSHNKQLEMCVQLKFSLDTDDLTSLQSVS